MRTHTAKLMQRTHRPVRRWVMQESHYDYIWNSYVNHEDEVLDVHTSTISRRMRGVTLPPWRSVTYYAETGSRCPAALEHDLRDYIGRCYRSRAAKEGLRAALAETLAELPQVDREDILDYCGDGDLARLWAVLQWHALCCDYADRYWC